MEDKIQIKRSHDADTRSTDKKEVSKEQLLDNTMSHIEDVQRVGYKLADLFKQQVLKHDYTKVDYIDEFHRDFNEQLKNDKQNFKEMPWFKERHLQERHHLNDRVPDDVNLLDVLEMVVDCSCAGLARSGDIYPIKIDQKVLEKAINNTKDLIINLTEVVDE